MSEQRKVELANEWLKSAKHDLGRQGQTLSDNAENTENTGKHRGKVVQVGGRPSYELDKC